MSAGATRVRIGKQEPSQPRTNHRGGYRVSLNISGKTLKQRAAFTRKGRSDFLNECFWMQPLAERVEFFIELVAGVLNIFA